MQKKNEILIDFDIKYMNEISLIHYLCPRLANKTDELKTIYGELLRRSNDADDYSHLLGVVTKIAELNL